MRACEIQTKISAWRWVETTSVTLGPFQPHGQNELPTAIRCAHVSAIRSRYRPPLLFAVFEECALSWIPDLPLRAVVEKLLRVVLPLCPRDKRVLQPHCSCDPNQDIRVVPDGDPQRAQAPTPDPPAAARSSSRFLLPARDAFLVLSD